METPARDDQERQERRDENNRIFAHGMHVENGVLQRGNYFLVVESMLIVAYSLLLSGEGVHTGSARIVCVLGFVLALAWVYVSWSASRYMAHVIGVAQARLPEYRVTRTTKPKTPVQTTIILNYLVPGLIGVMWMVLFTIA